MLNFPQKPPWYQHSLLLLMALRLGLLPYGPLLRCRSFVPCILELSPNRFGSRWSHGLVRVVLVLPCCRSHDVSIFFHLHDVTNLFLSTEFVQARNQFHKAGLDAKIGVYAFGWTWGAWGCITIAVILLFAGTSVGGSSDDKVRNQSNKGFFRRNRSTRSRGSFIDNDGQRRVKDEYA